MLGYHSFGLSPCTELFTQNLHTMKASHNMGCEKLTERNDANARTCIGGKAVSDACDSRCLLCGDIPF